MTFMWGQNKSEDTKSHPDLNELIRHNLLLTTGYIVEDETEWRIYASVQHTSIVSDNGLLPFRRQTII